VGPKLDTAEAVVVTCKGPLRCSPGEKLEAEGAKEEEDAENFSAVALGALGVLEAETAAAAARDIPRVSAGEATPAEGKSSSGRSAPIGMATRRLVEVVWIGEAIARKSGSSNEPESTSSSLGDVGKAAG